MNKWQLTGVLKDDPLTLYDNEVKAPVMIFTLSNGDKKKAWGEREKVWVLCRWRNPPEEVVERFKGGCLVYVLGTGFLAKRIATRPDGEEWRTNSLGLEVEEGRLHSGPPPEIYTKPRKSEGPPREDTEG